MKDRYFLVLVVCALFVWAVSPVWGEEVTQKTTTHPVPAPEEQNADAQPVEPEAATAAQEPAEQQQATTAPEQPAEQQPAEQQAAPDIKIEDAVVCQDVVDRLPIGSGDVFSKDISRVYCYNKVVGAQGEAAITHNWYYQGSLKASVSLPVRSSSWRTWSSKTITPGWAGEWMVEILSGNGTPLQSIVFFVQ